MTQFAIKAALTLIAAAPPIAFAAPVQAQAAQQKAAVVSAAQIAPNPADFAAAAFQISRAVEIGQAAQIWGGASANMKRILNRDQFVNTVQQRLTAHGQLQNRQWRNIVRTTVTQAQGNLQPGEYLSVELIGLDKNRKLVTQTVSFILEADGAWRLMGISEK